MDRTEFSDLIDEERFAPFVITTKNSFILVIGPEERRHTLAGASTLVVMDAEGRFTHLRYDAIDRINQLP
jgi:hypothetical protein